MLTVMNNNERHNTLRNILLLLTMYELFLESMKPDTNTILFDEEIKENIFYVNVLCDFMKNICCRSES